LLAGLDVLIPTRRHAQFGGDVFLRQAQLSSMPAERCRQALRKPLKFLATHLAERSEQDIQAPRP
jgi:hypothetical protein